MLGSRRARLHCRLSICFVFYSYFLSLSSWARLQPTRSGEVASFTALPHVKVVSAENVRVFGQQVDCFSSLNPDVWKTVPEEGVKLEYILHTR